MMQQPQQTATGTSQHVLQLRVDDPDETRVDLILEDTKRPHVLARIERLIRRERHFDVYSVDALTGHAEARAFIMNGVPQKVKRHRKRCISRLGHRIWLEASCRGAMVVVYWANKPGEEDSSSDKVFESLQKKDAVKKKTDYDREATRIRQLEKRRENRKRKAARKASRDASTPQDTRSMDDSVSDVATEISDKEIYFWAAIILYNNYDDRGRPRQSIEMLFQDSFLLDTIMMRSIKLDEFYRLLTIHELWIFLKGCTGHSQDEIQRATDNMVKIQELYLDQGFLPKVSIDKIQEFLEQMHEEFSNMPYRQLFSGIHATLSRISPEELRLTSNNHRLAILRHIKSVLPALLKNVQANRGSIEKMLEDNVHLRAKDMTQSELEEDQMVSTSDSLNEWTELLPDGVDTDEEGVD